MKALKALVKHIIGLDLINAVQEKIEVCTLVVETASADFKGGIQNALHIVFETIHHTSIIKGCWFHFINAIQKRISIEGLRVQYFTNQATHRALNYLRVVVALTYTLMIIIRSRL